MRSKINRGPLARWAAFAVGVLFIVSASVALATTLRLDEEEGEENDAVRRTPPPSATVPSPSPTPTRLGPGLHYTADELEIWRERARRGPYKSPGDAGPNSPGDWQRIVANAQSFLEEPASGRWMGPFGDDSGCVTQASERPSAEASNQLRDAAFYYLVTGESEYREAVQSELIAQMNETGVQFSDRGRWCPGKLYDLDPAFGVAQWLTKLLFAYDYLGYNAFDPEDRSALDQWFSNAAEFLQLDIESALNDNFVDRPGGDYTISATRSAAPGCTDTAYYGSPEICAVARYYNNRRGAQARYVGLVGVHLQRRGCCAVEASSFQETGTRFFEEWLEYSVYPEGFSGEFERWTDSNPSLGWSYAANSVGAAITLADAMARVGDAGLYDYATSDGDFGTEGGPKSLRTTVQDLGRYVDGTYERYATDSAYNVGDPAYLIKSYHRESDWHAIHDVVVTPANLFYRDEYIRRMYTRTGPDMPPYPVEPAPNGENEVWTGEAGVYPGVLFMFGELEDQTPFASTLGADALPSPPNRFRPDQRSRSVGSRLRERRVGCGVGVSGTPPLPSGRT